MLSVQSPKDWYKDWRSWKKDDKWRPSELQPEYWEESRIQEETCCHLDSRENYLPTLVWKIHKKENNNDNDNKLLWDFDIQTDHLILARRPDLKIINNKKKRTCEIVDFAVSTDHRIKLKKKWKKG